MTARPGEQVFAEGGTEDRVPELLRRVQRLEQVARQNAAGLHPGDYLTAVRGRGLIFHESRKYVPGEPVRSIDWNITARQGEPYVRVHLEERRREVFVVLDVSPSMAFGSGRKTKLELGVELAATLAVSVQRAGDRLGHVLFADRVLAESRPAAGGKQLFRVLRSLLEHVEPWTREVTESDPRTAIHGIQKYPGRFVVFLISDFMDHDLPEDLKYLQARHDVSLLHVYDPLEYAEELPLRFRARSPEGSGRPRWASPGSLGEMESFLDDKCGRFGLSRASFSTDEPVRSALERFLIRVPRRRVP